MVVDSEVVDEDSENTADTSGTESEGLESDSSDVETE